MYKWDAGEALTLIEREQPTTWLGVPTMVSDLVEHPKFGSTNVSSLRFVGSGGAPTPAAQVGTMRTKFALAAPRQGYGLTETNGAVSQNGGENYIHRPTSCGPPSPIVEAKVLHVDGSGRVVEQAGIEGELVFKSSLIMKGYWRNAKATAEAIVSVDGDAGWFRTGDIAYIDADGFIHITDRAKDIIIRGGENISCPEVEAAFYEHDAVRECAVFGLPCERLGEVPAVMVLLKQVASSHLHSLPQSDQAAALRKELHRFVRQRLATFKVPDEHNILFAPRTLPRGATGKIHKRQIRAKVLEAIDNSSRPVAKL
jgi:long-chain acyl-CoA synthetase